MKEMTVAAAAELAGENRVSGPADSRFGAVVTDSRKATAGTLFIGLVGEKNDGTKFAESAYGAGCRAMLLTAGHPAVEEVLKHGDAAVIEAEDTLTAMQKLAKGYLAGCRAKKIAITGSTGKTTTKEMTYAVISSRYKTICNHENFNNHIGVPLTAFTVEEDTEIGIFEMGMNHRDEIRPLADIVRPEAAAITNIGVSHIGNLGSRENICEEKMNITHFMGEGDLFVFNADDDIMSRIAGVETAYEKLGQGEQAGPDGVAVSDVKDNGIDGITFTLTYGGKSVPFRLTVPGRHNAWNAAVAAALGLRYGISLEESAAVLENFSNTGKRLLRREGNGITVIDDTYNANPESAMAGVKVLAATPAERRVAVLADMLELGDGEEEMNRDTLRFALEQGVELVVAVGSIMSRAAAGIGEDRRLVSFETKEEFIASAGDIIRRGDVILVKGSHSTHIDEAAAYLAEN
ncbi:MAG: UDP-N-acetylmuramoyl-tripeptide--D-alanyl-D-alanine ligase, partial [Clostridia bacterium]|nr:UDP-N-acetylmuramoyl-tripeptide--D-alanyl-D-alanine ligase [Clostridia bacterium]